MSELDDLDEIDLAADRYATTRVAPSARAIRAGRKHLKNKLAFGPLWKRQAQGRDAKRKVVVTLAGQNK
jgi:hypothetical protein